jgi:lysozyme family protein
MTETELVDAIFEKEGDAYGDQHTTPPIDQPTARGGLILATVRSYAAAHGLPVPTIETLRTMSHATAAAIVQWKLRAIAREHRFDRITFEPLRYQMVDFAYNSGEGTAIRWLQRILRVPRSSTIDQATEAALEQADLWLVNAALVGARLLMIDMWSDPDPTRPKDANVLRKNLEEGLENRALRFSLLEVP